MTRPWHCMSLWRRLIHKKANCCHVLFIFCFSFFFQGWLVATIAVILPSSTLYRKVGVLGLLPIYCRVLDRAWRRLFFSEVSVNPVNARPRAFFRVLRHFRREQSAYNHLDCVDLCAVKLRAGFGRISPEVIYYEEERSLEIYLLQPILIS